MIAPLFWCLLTGTAFYSVLRIVRGVRGVVVGTEPYCRLCGYNLSGATNSVCSECGATLSLTCIRIGVHKLRSRHIFQGIALLFVVAVLAAINAPHVLQRAVDQHIWYRYVPEQYLLEQARTGDAACFGELTRRLASNQLSPKCLASCSQIAVKAFEAPDSSQVAHDWIHLLGILADRQLLSGEACDRYYSGVAKIEFEVRTPVEGDGTLPGRTLVVSRAPKTSTLFWRCRDAATVVDGELRHTQETVDGRVAGDDASVAYDIQVPLGGIATGRHAVEHQVTIDVSRGPFIEGAEPDIVYSRKLRFRREIEVAATGCAPPVSAITAPSLRAEILDRISVNFNVGYVNRTNYRAQIDCELVVRPPIPCDLAFDVYVYSGDVANRVGKLVVGKNLSHSLVTRMKSISLAVGEKTRQGIELRPSMSLAKESVDAWNIWNGVLFLH